MDKYEIRGRGVTYESDRKEHQKGAVRKGIHSGTVGAEVMCDAEYDFQL